jgi:hypothetical protein
MHLLKEPNSCGTVRHTRRSNTLPGEDERGREGLYMISNNNDYSEKCKYTKMMKTLDLIFIINERSIKDGSARWWYILPILTKAPTRRRDG